MMKVMNYVSAICFFLSSSSLLFVPFLNLEDKFPIAAYFLASVFWCGLLGGIGLQLLLWIKSKKLKKIRDLKKVKLIFVVLLGICVLSSILIICLLKNDNYALPINLFTILLSIEAYFIIKRMEWLL